MLGQGLGLGRVSFLCRRSTIQIVMLAATGLRPRSILRFNLHCCVLVSFINLWPFVVCFFVFITLFNRCAHSASPIHSAMADYSFASYKQRNKQRQRNVAIPIQVRMQVSDLLFCNRRNARHLFCNTDGNPAIFVLQQIL